MLAVRGQVGTRAKMMEVGIRPLLQHRSRQGCHRSLLSRMPELSGYGGVRDLDTR